MQNAGTFRWRHRRSTVAVALVAALVLGACGGGGGGGTETTADDTTSSSSPATTAESTTTTRRPTVAYPSGGPKGAVFPPGTEAYAMLSEGRCQALRGEIDGDSGWEQVEPEVTHLYRAATSACLGRWADAIRRFDQLQALDPDFSDTSCAQEGPCPRCLKLVYDWVADLVRRRQADPGFAPRFVRSSAPNPCPSSTTSSSSSSPSSSSTTTTTAGTSTSRG